MLSGTVNGEGLFCAVLGQPEIGVCLAAILLACLAGLAMMFRCLRLRTRAFDAELAERKRAEADLRLSEEKYRTLIEQASDGIFVVDDLFRLVEVNRAGAAMLGYSVEEIKGADFTRFIDPDDLAKNPPSPTLLDQEKSVVRERLFVRKDGSRFPGEIHARKTPTNFYVSIVRDLTTRKMTEARLKRINEDLERRVAERTMELQSAYDELESFSYSVAHDLRAPLRAMNGYATIVLREHKGEVTEEGRALLERISANAKKMGQLIDSLLGYARMSRTELHAQEVSVAEIAAEAWKDCAEGEARVPEFEIEPNLPKAVADPSMLKLLLLNLFDNAIKFSRDAASPRVEVGYDAERAAYFVRDNGAGFDPQFKHKLFGVFERLHTTEFEGTGVGLAIVKRIANRHGGDAWAGGEVGGGATFWFSLDSHRTLQQPD